MKRLSVLVAVAAFAVTILSGCVVVPLGGWYGGDGYYHHPYAYGPYSR
jgi:hypothetical protein